MALPSTDDLKALCERTPMGPWAAISDYPYISIVMANAPDELFAPIVDIVDSTTDEPEVEPTHELIALAPDLARELLRLRRELVDLRGLMYTHAGHLRKDGHGVAAHWAEGHAYRLTRILNGDTNEH